MTKEVKNKIKSLRIQLEKGGISQEEANREMDDIISQLNHALLEILDNLSI